MYKVEVKRTDNANKFREAALSFQKNGYYTPHPKGTTAYKKYWDEESDRCINGFTTEDGEWISGYFYFYLNYSPIIKVESQGDGKRGKRVRNFPDFWDYDRAFYDAVEEAERQAKHLTYLKPRGVGCSFKAGSMLARNFFLIRESTSLAVTEEQESLTKDGVLTKAWDIVDFVNEHTAWTKKSQKTNTKMHKRASMVVNNGSAEIEMGYKSEIIGFSVKNNPDKGRGKRFKLCFVDEIGLVTSPVHLFSVMRHGAEEGDTAYGLIILAGTGGTSDADYSEMRRLFYEPSIYNFLEIENVWDDGQYGKACGFFWPRYYNMRGFMDENGNSFVEEAKKHEELERSRIIENSSDVTQIDRYCAERPLCPEEALLQVSQNIFPKKELLQHLNYIRTRDKVRNYKQVGDLDFGPNGDLKWFPSKKPKDITSYRLNKDSDKRGQIVIWEHPCENPPYALYCIGVDPYDIDQAATSSSLGSCIVYKRFQSFEKYNELIVAEYTGRPDTVEEFYENCRKLALYYNAKILYENEKKGLFIHFAHKHCEYLLADQPSIIKDIVQDSKVQRGKGIHMPKQVKQYGELRIRDYLNEEYEPGKKGLTKILSEPLLEELIEYNPDGNFDRCLMAETNVHTIDGFKKIVDIQADDLVLSKDGTYNTVISKIKKSHSGLIYKIRATGTNEYIECNPEHPLYVSNSKRDIIRRKKYREDRQNLVNGRYLAAKDLTKKHYLFIPKRKNLENCKHSDEFLYLLGWYLSDGYININANILQITLQENQYAIALKLKDIIESNVKQEIFIKKGYTDKNNRVVRSYAKKHNPIVTISKIKNKKAYNIRITSHELVPIIYELCGGPFKKLINQSLYNTANLLPLVIGYLEGDGHQKRNCKYDGYKREVIECSSVYKDLVKQIRQILLDNGIWNSITTKNRRSESKEQYCITIPRKNINKIAQDSLKFHVVDCVNIIDKSFVIETDAGYWSPIKEIITYEDTVDLYNLEVTGDKSYIANYVVNHNCISFLLIMIYREELHHIVINDAKKENKRNLFFPDGLFKRNNENPWIKQFKDTPIITPWR